MSNAFEEANNVEIKDETPEVTNALSVLVGEGKKFSDAESLAKGKLEADNFIAKLTQENAQLRESVGKSQTAHEVLAEIKAELAAKENQVPNPNENTTQIKDESPDLAALVQQEMDKFSKGQRAEHNIQKAQEGLAKTVGADNVSAAIAKKAKELNVSTDFLKDTAVKSPEAFLSFFPKSSSGTAPSVTNGDVNTEALRNATNAPSDKVEQDIAELRKTPLGKRNKEWHVKYMDATARRLHL